MIALLASVLLMSLVGSPHCAAMCGGFVCFYSGQPGTAGRGRLHLAYNLGRLVSYVSLGAIAGTLGAGLDRLGATAGFNRAAAVVAGTVMIAWAGATLLAARTGGSVAVPVPAPLGPAPPVQGSGPARGTLAGRARPVGFASAGIAAALRAVHRHPPVMRALVVGLVTTLLPCGFLYAYVAVAAGTGSAGAGALAMAAFWLGTVPAMVTVGLVARRALGPFQRRLPAVSAAALMIVGLLTLTGKFHVHAHPGMPGEAPHAGHAGHQEAPARDGDR